MPGPKKGRSLPASDGPKTTDADITFGLPPDLAREYRRLLFNVEQANLNGNFDTAHHQMLARFEAEHAAELNQTGGQG